MFSLATLGCDSSTLSLHDALPISSTTPTDLGHGTVTGSNPADPGETVTGTLAVAGATGYVAQSRTEQHGAEQQTPKNMVTHTLPNHKTRSDTPNNSADKIKLGENF